MSFSDPLAVLSVSDRNRLESLVMKFEEAWKPTMLEQFAEGIATDSGPQFLEVVLPELVKVDMQRAWSAGCGQTLDCYLETYPSLGTTRTVRADLVAAEFEARQAVEPRIDFSDYQLRFPEQFLIAKNILDDRSSVVSPSQEVPGAGAITGQLEDFQASTDTSRIVNANETKRETSGEFVSDLPVEFGRYRIVKELGAGAMGRVYLAHDTQLDRQVALKTPSFTDTENKDLVVRFYREARAAAKLQHRNICPVHDVGEIGGRHFISMAFIQGKPLSDFVRPGKLPTPRSAAMLVQRIAIAMAEAHHHNVIHRDLKPANIMIDRKKEPVVMDFGLARELDSTSQFTQQGVAVGTPAYMAPEQIRGELDDVGTTADVYALGIILYELLTGKLPFRGPMAKVVYGIVHEEPTRPSELQSGIDSALEAICMKMMAKERENRYSSMEDVADALRTYLKAKNTNRGDSGKEITGDKANVSQAKAGDKAVMEPETDSVALGAFLASQSEPRQSAPIVVPASKSDRMDVDNAVEAKASPLGNERHNLPSASPHASPRGKASRAKRGLRLPVAIGVVLVLCLFAGVTFLMQAGDAVIRVVINDPSIGFKIQNETLTFDDNGREIKLLPTDDNKLLISVGDNTFQTEGTFELLKGTNPAVEVTLLSGELVAKLGNSELGRWQMKEIVASDDRSIWVHDRGFFRKGESGDWTEISPNGKTFQFAETSRSPQVIELRALDGNTSIRVRLFADRAEFASARALQYKKVFDGWWHTLESKAMTASATESTIKPGMKFEGALTWNNVNEAFARGTKQNLDLHISKVSGPRFWGTLQIEWNKEGNGMDGIAIGNQIQWTNHRNGRTVYGTFDGATIKAVSESGHQEFSLASKDADPSPTIESAAHGSRPRHRRSDPMDE